MEITSQQVLQLYSSELIQIRSPGMSNQVARALILDFNHSI